MPQRSLLQQCEDDKVADIALYMVAQEILEKLGITPARSLAETCREQGINRSQVYETAAAIKKLLDQVSLPARGRPPSWPQVSRGQDTELANLNLRLRSHEYRLDHPGAVVVHATGRTEYSAGYRRFVLGEADKWSGTALSLCEAIGLPYPTFRCWLKLDGEELASDDSTPCHFLEPKWPATPSETARTIAADFRAWEGTVAAFLIYEAKRLSLSPSIIKKVLRISSLIAKGKTRKGVRYRGSTLRPTPGQIVVTDGKEVAVQIDTDEGVDLRSFNWQGTVDQATACHTAVVVSDTENAESVAKAWQDTCDLLGHPPAALVHDNKPIHDDEALRDKIEKSTEMIPATPSRPENKAVIEGEFGKFEQQFGLIKLDGRSRGSLISSVVHEIIRAYTAGINHAGRFEFNGKSRLQILREACPDPAKDKKLIESLKEGHPRGGKRRDPLPTASIARKILDEAFEPLGLTNKDPLGRLRTWLANAYEPEAIRRAIAIFTAKRDGGALKGPESHRYLVKVIQGCQADIELEREERKLLELAAVERKAWLQDWEEGLHEIQNTSSSNEEILREIAERAVFGGMILEKAFWERALTRILTGLRGLFETVLTHVRRLYEASQDDRRRLMSRLVSWYHGLERIEEIGRGAQLA